MATYKQGSMFRLLGTAVGKKEKKPRLSQETDVDVIVT